MKLSGWVLRWVSPDFGGAATMAVLRGLAKRRGHEERELKRTVRELIESRELVMISDRRHATYALPKPRRTTSPPRTPRSWPG